MFFFFLKLARSLCHTAPPAVSLGTAIYLRLSPRPLPRTTVPFRSAEVTYANACLPWQLKGKSSLISTLSSFFFFCHHSSSSTLLALTLDVTLHQSEKRLVEDSMSEGRLIPSVIRHRAALCTIAKSVNLLPVCVSVCLLSTPAFNHGSRIIASVLFCTYGWRILVLSSSRHDDIQCNSTTLRAILLLYGSSTNFVLTFDH